MLNLKITSLFMLCLFLLPANAQQKWFNPMNTDYPVIQNQGWTKEIGNSYARLPQRAKSEVREPLWNLSRNSAGLAIHFYSNANNITIRYKVEGSYSMPHMPNTGVSGIDLYAIDSDGNLKLASGSYKWGDTISFNYKIDAKDKYHNLGFEYRLYLPTYTSVKWLEIGIPENADLEFIPLREELPIVAYGTSITQGACATRPGMAWTNIVSRSLDLPVINLGFSGNGKLEKEVINYINELDAQLYILDCLPNLPGYKEEDVFKKVVDAVKQIRSKHNTPILLTEHAGYSNAGLDTTRLRDYTIPNKASRKAYESLLADGVKDLWYLSNDELNFSMDSWVDYVHPSDLGMQFYADAYNKKIREILKMSKGNLTTTCPVTQRREPGNYEWLKRHREILQMNKANPPKAVVFGNSIMHFWGGEPKGPRSTGKDSWEAYMEPLGFRNFGYGWDRIENVLWRVYHGELDGYKADRILIKIGTNNFGVNSDKEILAGLDFLYTAIRQRQPEATVTVLGILPRRGMEKRVASINKEISKLAKKQGFIYKNVNKDLLLSNGQINESLFGDGLHPNAEGYKIIGKKITE